MYKVAFKNLGCKVNSYEMMKMRENIPHSFYEVNFKEKADIYIINTCSVTHVADRKSRQMIHQAKKRNENALIVVCGCYVNNILLTQNEIKCDKEINIDINDDKSIKKNIKLFDENILYIKNDIKEKTWDLIIKKLQKKYKNSNFINDDKSNNILPDDYKKELKNKDNYVVVCDNQCSNNISNFEGEKVRGFLKIEDGCNNFCSYCIIPYLRGRIKSRKLDDIIKDAKNMVKNGKKEIVLTGIDINAYGMDFENRFEKNIKKNISNSENIIDTSKSISINKRVNKKNINIYLYDVIEAICNIDGVLRVRIGSLHPFTITENFIKKLADVKKNKYLDKFCPEFHISLQSGSDEVLKNMNRKYTTKDYEKAVNIVRKHFKNATITTDIIVGFPKETDKNFEETCNFVKKIKFYKPHIFKYSIRKETIAANMPQVEDSIKEKREKILINLCKRISDNIRKNQNKKSKEVLVEEIKKIDDKYCAIGFTKEYMKAYAILEKPYNIKEKRDKLVGKIIKVLINI